MATKVITVYELQRWDGGDRTNHYAYLTSEEEANKMKGTGDYVGKRDFVIHDTKQDVLDFKNGEVKRKALAKLTPEEIKAVRYGRSIIFNDDQTNQAFQLFKMKQVVINMMVDESETLTQFEIDLLNV